jgi:D-alanine-D-alanine ligase
MKSISPETLGKKRIGVLMGGMSAEREVSIQSGEAILGALAARGYEACGIDVNPHLPQQLRDEKIEVAFIGLHGRLGEDGAVQGLLELMRIPYTGSGVLASALAMNKEMSRRIFRQANLPVPPSLLLRQGEEEKMRGGNLPFPWPVVVKPSQEGSSVGVTLVQGEEEMARALVSAFAYGPEILIEPYIRGREIQVGILNDISLGAIEIIPKAAFYNYEAKYREGLAEHRFPASLSKEDYRRSLDLALQAHRCLGCEGATRVDLLYGTEGDFTLLEVNTLPGMTALSLLPEIARGVGIIFEELVEKILLGARLKIPVRTNRDGSPF